MQIDFHHAVMYVLSRLAGFTKDEAEIISYSSQYVDDATNDGIIEFINGAKYHRISSAHKSVDLHNINDVNNQSVWVPFHFLPGNSGLKAGEDPDGGFIKKLICRPNSYVAQEMLDKCIADRDKPYALHRLGITLHVLADTFSHQDFAGVVNTMNIKGNIEIDDKYNSLNSIKSKLPRINKNYKSKNKIPIFFVNLFSVCIGSILPLGHGAVLTLPDIPYLKWSYTNDPDILFERDNSDIFIKAVQNIFRFLKKFREVGTPNPNIKEEIPENYLDEIRKNIFAFTDEDGKTRHNKWLEAIANGQFGFKDNVKYVAKGQDSWKYFALNTSNDEDTGYYEYNENFLKSDWKLFHDALQKHEFEIAHEILPKYGICVA